MPGPLESSIGILIASRAGAYGAGCFYQSTGFRVCRLVRTSLVDDTITKWKVYDWIAVYDAQTGLINLLRQLRR